MKRYFYFPLIILSMLLALTGCGGSDDPDTPVTPPVEILGFTPMTSAESWFEKAEAVQSLGYDPQVMVVIFALDNLPYLCGTNDVVAAFVGDQCRYAAHVFPFEGKLLGSIVMYRTETDGTKPLSFSIRCHNFLKKGYFTSQPITFETNETIGSLNAPAHLSWVTK